MCAAPCPFKAAAKAAGLTRYSTGKPCANGHISDRNIRGSCVECLRLNCAKFRGTDKGAEARRRQQLKWSDRLKKYGPSTELRCRVKKYGLTVEDYKKMNAAQGGKCAICSLECNTSSRLSVDHCHKTGKIRGLLCRKCNMAIGNFSDSISILNAAIDYLSRGPQSQ